VAQAWLTPIARLPISPRSSRLIPFTIHNCTTRKASPCSLGWTSRPWSRTGWIRSLERLTTRLLAVHHKYNTRTRRQVTLPQRATNWNCLRLMSPTTGLGLDHLGTQGTARGLQAPTTALQARRGLARGNRRREASLQRGRRPLAAGKQRDARDQRWRPPPRNERQWPSPCNLQKTTRTPLPVFYSCHWFVASPRR